MKILACVQVGDAKIIQAWDVEKDQLIVRQFPSGEAIVLPLDASRIRMTTEVDDLIKKLTNSPQEKEYAEAVIDSTEQAYLGNLNISDAVLIQSN